MGRIKQSQITYWCHEIIRSQAEAGGCYICLLYTSYDAKELFEALKENDIYVRFWGSERIEQYMRITVGTREEMEAMFAFLKKYMNK